MFVFFFVIPIYAHILYTKLVLNSIPDYIRNTIGNFFITIQNKRKIKNLSVLRSDLIKKMCVYGYVCVCVCVLVFFCMYSIK